MNNFQSKSNPMASSFCIQRHALSGFSCLQDDVNLRRDEGLVHTETFSCDFVLFTVLKGIENNQLITWNNTKTQENVSVCTGPKTVT